MGFLTDQLSQPTNPDDEEGRLGFIGNTAPPPMYEGPQSEEQSGGGHGFFGTVFDSIGGIFQGAAGAVESIAELPTLLPGVDYDLPENLGLGHASTGVGRFIEGISQFASPFLVPGVGGLAMGRAAARAMGVAHKSRVASRALRIAGKKGRAAVVGAQGEIVAATIGGAAVDFAAFGGREERLSDLIEAAPALSNPVTRFLQHDDEDGEAAGRIKNVLEGAALGIFVDSVFTGLKSLRAYRRATGAGMSPEKAAEAARAETIRDQVDLIDRGLEAGGMDPESSRKTAMTLAGMDFGLNKDRIHYRAPEPGDSPSLFQDTVPREIPEVLEPEAMAGLSRSVSETGGFTYSPHYNKTKDTGYAVSLFPEKERIVSKASFSQQDIEDFIETNRDFISEDNRRHVGAWTDDNNVYLDVAVVMDDRILAENLGEKFNQKAIWDLTRGEEIRLKYKTYDDAGSGVKARYDHLEGPGWLNDVSDVKTALQERAIAVRRTLLDDHRSLPVNERVWSEAELDAIDEAVGLKPGADWTPEAEAKFADLFVAYVRDFDSANPSSLTDIGMSRLANAMDARTNTTLEVNLDVDIPPFLRDMFDKVKDRSNVDDVIDVMGREAQAAFAKSGVATNAGRAPLKARTALNTYEDKMAKDYGPDWTPDMLSKDQRYRLKKKQDAATKEIHENLETEAGRKFKEVDEQMAKKYGGAEKAEWSPSDKSLHTRALKAVEKQEAELMAVANTQVGVLEASVRRDALNEEIALLDSQFVRRNGFDWEHDAETWLSADPDYKRLLELRKERDGLSDYIYAREQPNFASEVFDKHGLGGARKHPKDGAGVPNVARAAGDSYSVDVGKDIMEEQVKDLAEQLEALPEHLRGVIEDKKRLVAKNLFDAAGDPKAFDHFERQLDKASDGGARFMATVEVVREKVAEVTFSLQESLSDLDAAVARGDSAAANAAKHDILYYYNLQEPLTKFLAESGYLQGYGLQQRNKVWPGKVLTRSVDPAHSANVLREAQRSLKDTYGTNLDDFIERIRAVTEEGELAVMKMFNSGPTGPMDPLLEVFYNSLLSGPRTHAVNTLSNFFMGMLNVFTRRTGRVLTGSDRKTFGMFFAMKKFSGDAWRAARIAMKNNSPQLDVGNRAFVDQASGVAQGRSAIAEGVAKDTNLPAPFKEGVNWLARIIGVGGYATRALAGMDEFFKQIHYRSMVHEQIFNEAIQRPSLAADPQALSEYVEEAFNKIVISDNAFTEQGVLMTGYKDAVNRGLNKRHAREAAYKFRAKHWDPKRGALADRALEYARTSTFTNRNAKEYGKNPISRAIQGAGVGVQRMTGEVPMLRLIVPFINTPANLLSIASDYMFSPIFDAVPAGKGVRSLLKREAVDELTEEATGRLAVSSMIYSSVIMGVWAGNVTGGGPQDPQQRQLLISAGWQPYSIRVGDTYLAYGRMDPMASTVGVIADVAESMGNNPFMKHEEETVLIGLLVATQQAMARNLSEKSFLAGAINMAAAIDNPEFYGQQVGENILSSVVPNALNQTSGQLDPTLREARGLLDKLIYKSPMRSTLAPRRNFLGEERNHTLYAGGVLGALNPFAHSEASDDLLMQEATSYGKGIDPPDSVKYGDVDLHDYTNRSGQTAYDRWLELHGKVKIDGRSLRQALTQTVKSSEYRQLSEFGLDGESSPRMDAFKKVLFRYRQEALLRVLEEFPHLKKNFNIAKANAASRRLGRPERSLLDIVNPS